MILPNIKIVVILQSLFILPKIMI